MANVWRLGNTLKSNIHENASFPQSTKVGTQENKCIHSSIRHLNISECLNLNVNMANVEDLKNDKENI